MLMYVNVMNYVAYITYETACTYLKPKYDLFLNLTKQFKSPNLTNQCPFDNVSNSPEAVILCEVFYFERPIRCFI